ncbi:tyrosine-type recombinase/integrase [Anatilimnocola sp. NA78]|uniref:tyrosine-type recombinase/integrase n=1 Tax=Anatilimnocola sp. NA78 TaxID=3415683 RepID=UPI003CE5853E
MASSFVLRSVDGFAHATCCSSSSKTSSNLCKPNSRHRKAKIGFEHSRLHSFRHYFCSQCFPGGASKGEIKEWLGHAHSKMVEHYRHLRGEDAQRKMSQIRFLDRVESRTGS